MKPSKAITTLRATSVSSDFLAALEASPLMRPYANHLRAAFDARPLSERIEWSVGHVAATLVPYQGDELVLDKVLMLLEENLWRLPLSSVPCRSRVAAALARSDEANRRNYGAILQSVWRPPSLRSTTSTFGSTD